MLGASVWRPRQDSNLRTLGSVVVPMLGASVWRPRQDSNLRTLGSVVVPMLGASVWRPRQDSNLRTRLRRPMLYPLSYEGGACRILGRKPVTWAGRPSRVSAQQPVAGRAAARAGFGADLGAPKSALGGSGGCVLEPH